MMNDTKKLFLTHFDFVAYVSIKTYEDALSKHHFNQRLSTINTSQYKTIAVVGLAYAKEPVKFKGKGYGVLSRYSYGTDYHKVFKDRFEKINQLHPEYLCLVDSEVINERLAAALTYEGFIGKNQAFIHKEYGPYVYLGTILIPDDINVPFMEVDSCKDCNKCVEACPTGALDNGFNLNRCLSQITQAKAPLEEFHIKHIRKMVYGCDVCYQVCPKTNADLIPKHPEFMPTGIENIDLLELLSMSNKSYYNKFKNNASSWRGATVIKKNALSILYNQNVVEAIPIIKQSIQQIDADWYQSSARTILEKFKEF